MKNESHIQEEETARQASNESFTKLLELTNKIKDIDLLIEIRNEAMVLSNLSYKHGIASGKVIWND